MPSTTAPTGARAARSRQRALGAARELLFGGGFGAVTIEAVAARSGVARTTIYRHWATRQALVADAIKGEAASYPEPDTGLVQEDVRIILTGLAAALTSSPWAQYLPSLLDAARRDPELAATHRADLALRQAPLRRVLARGIERGELPAASDVDLLMSSLAGPLLFRRMITDESVDAEFASAVTDTVFQGVFHRGAAANDR